MNDKFDDALRDSLHRAVPPAPDEPNRSDGARAYAARARRNRTGLFAAGAAAVVVAAIAIVPSVVQDGSQGRGPAAEPTQTQATQSGELPADPVECPTGDADAIDAPPNGVIAPGAVLARVCATQLNGIAWTPPLDALTTDVASIVDTFNDLPAADGQMACTEELGPAYLMVFQYPDGHSVQVRGDMYGCEIVTFGAEQRQGATDAVNAYFEALAAQRDAAGSVLAGPIEPPACPEQSFSAGLSLMPLSPADQKLHAVAVCSYSAQDGTHTGQGNLSDEQVDEVNLDLQANGGDSEGPSAGCVMGDELLLLITTNAYGDVIVFTQFCETFASSADAESGWEPTEKTRAMLMSVLR